MHRTSGVAFEGTYLSPERKTSFFGEMLGNSAHRELKVSRAFAACFAGSQTFRRQTLRYICKSCGIPTRTATLDSWRCETEVTVARGRVDIRLVPDTTQTPTIILENKVAAPLTKEQLLRYKSRGSRTRLVVVTKHYPEVGGLWLRNNHIVSLRWQDFHRILGALDVGSRGVDRFLSQEFRTYLEELDMAHREDLTRTDIHRVAALFRTIDVPHVSDMDAEPGFRAGADMIHFLNEVLRRSRERQPELERWKRWGTRYFKWRPDRNSPWQHHLAFRLMKHGWQEYFGAGIMLAEGSQKPCWVVSGQSTRDKWIEYDHAITRVCKGNGVLDVDKLVHLYLDGLKKSGLLKIK